VTSYFLLISSYWNFFSCFRHCPNLGGFVSKFENFQSKNVSLTFIDCHYTTKHFNHFEFVERLSMPTNDGLWILTSNIVCDTWSNNVDDIFRLGFHINIETMFISYVLGTIFECDKFWGLHFNSFHVSISSISHLF
jgi:hypothetical protein